MVFLQLFETLKGKTLIFKLQNNIIIEGCVETVDHFFNFRISSPKINTELSPDQTGIDIFSCLNEKDDIYINGRYISSIEIPEECVNLGAFEKATSAYWSKLGISLE